MPSINSVFNTGQTSNGSMGDINDPMYRNIKCEGEYLPYSGRKIRRYQARLMQKTISLTRIQPNSPTRSNKGFGI